jgi:hypothetical protein
MKTLSSVIVPFLLLFPLSVCAADGCKSVEFADHIELDCSGSSTPTPDQATGSAVTTSPSAIANPDIPSKTSAVTDQADSAKSTDNEPAMVDINPQPVVVPAEAGQGIRGNYSRRIQRQDQAQRPNSQRPEVAAPLAPSSTVDGQPQTVPGR